MIRFSCPGCRAQIKAPPDAAGKKVACPKCKQRVLIPAPASKQESGATGDIGKDFADLNESPPVQKPFWTPKTVALAVCAIVGLIAFLTIVVVMTQHRH